MLSEVMAAAVAVLGPAPQTVTKEVHWVERPTANDVAAAYPDRAQDAQVSGRAELECVVGADGRMDYCRAFAEAPVGQGFGAAALELAPKFRMEMTPPPPPGTAPTVYIPIHFQIAPGTPAPESLVMNSPRWASAPTFEDVGRAFPASAKSATGDVTLHCDIDVDGALSACATRREQPAGQGFAVAAEALTSRFRIEYGAAWGPHNVFAVDLKFHFSDPNGDEFLQRRVIEPTWLTLFEPGQITTLFPAAASAKGVRTGRGVALCAVGADGTLQDCAPLAGEPDGLGFSNAAVKIVSGMRMNPWTEAGGPVNGARVQLPIRFDLPAAKP